MMNCEISNMGKSRMFLLPAARGTCPECAVVHDPEQPHNQQSLFYQVKFQMEHDRSPTWADAMAHCTEEVKRYWKDSLAKRGVTV